MRFLMTLVLFGLPGVARTSRLGARQGTPSGNSSAILPPQGQSSQTEPAAPSLVAITTRVTSPSNIPKQERGPQGDDSGPLGPPPQLPPDILPPVELPPEESITTPTTETTSTSTDADTNIDTTTLALSSPTTGASVRTSLAEPTTIVTKSSLLVGASPPTTLFTSKTTPGVITSTPSEESGTTTTTPHSDSPSPTTKPGTMSNPTATPSSDSGSGNNTLTIALSTVLSVTGVILIAIAVYLCTGARRKRIPVFKRGITPIGDDEIATWKTNRSAEKVADRYTTRPSHSQNGSTSTRRAPSVIQYQHGGRPSLDVVSSPRSFIDSGKYSFDLPQAPGAVLARAPNARSGLTDETVPGDDPFLPSPKRHPSRLHKLPPSSPSMHGRTKGSRSSSLRSFAEAAWRQGDGAEAGSGSPRGSSDAYSRNYRMFSNSSIPPPPRLDFGDNEQLTGLSPPPSRRNDSTIGLAVG
ncbi:hypothetical protein F4819DRAFT_486458 [Hypoxylon fuscum]|nr:hypothetical protein F4819DRAFT_486458 [Hypoxylon fuscum]